jgi:hypothetical protein
MASVWIEKRGRGEAIKIAGGLSLGAAKAAFPVGLNRLLKERGGRLLYAGKWDALIEFPDGDRSYAYVELQTPSSAPEKGQPRFLPDGRGVVLTPNGLIPIGAEPTS